MLKYGTNSYEEQISLEKLENIIVEQTSTEYENQFLFHNSVHHIYPKEIYNLLCDAVT